MNNRNKIKLLTTAALFCAMTAALTGLLRFPTPLGYVHLGDVVIYLAAATLPLPYAMAAGALGGAIADYSAGYPQWILPTMLIKALITLPIAALSKRHPACSAAEPPTPQGLFGYGKGKISINRKPTASHFTVARIVAAVALAGLITTGGYFIAAWAMYGLAAALLELSGYAAQATMSGLSFAVLCRSWKAEQCRQSKRARKSQ